MPMPYYVSPEQMMQDKAEYAKKGIAKGRSIIAMEYADGILLAADNPSASLHKISEVYDNIAFAGAGKYSEFENLRKAGIRHADLNGFMYSREDVSARISGQRLFAKSGHDFQPGSEAAGSGILVVQVGRNDHPTRCIASRSTAASSTRRDLRSSAEVRSVQAYLKERCHTPARRL